MCWLSYLLQVSSFFGKVHSLPNSNDWVHPRSGTMKYPEVKWEVEQVSCEYLDSQGETQPRRPGRSPQRTKPGHPTSLTDTKMHRRKGGRKSLGHWRWPLFLWTQAYLWALTSAPTCIYQKVASAMVFTAMNNVFSLVMRELILR